MATWITGVFMNMLLGEGMLELLELNSVGIVVSYL